MDRGYVITNERLLTSVPNVYAVGMDTPGLQLAIHRGFQHGIFVAEEIAGLKPDRDRGCQHPQTSPNLDPEVASVGLSH
jgi:dihydrolipoamide dehydrogenase